MLEMGTSGLMSGEGKRVGSSRFRYRALPRLYAQTASLVKRQRTVHACALKRSHGGNEIPPRNRNSEPRLVSPPGKPSPTDGAPEFYPNRISPADDRIASARLLDTRASRYISALATQSLI